MNKKTHRAKAWQTSDTDEPRLLVGTSGSKLFANPWRLFGKPWDPAERYKVVQRVGATCAALRSNVQVPDAARQEFCARASAHQFELGRRTFLLRESVFQPSTGKEASGFHDTSFHNFMKCDVDIRKVVVLSGGTNIFQRIVEHMTKEPTALAPSTMKIEASAPIRRGSKDLSCFPSVLSGCGPRGAGSMNLAAPASTAALIFCV